jgi:hypothetical protein
MVGQVQLAICVMRLVRLPTVVLQNVRQKRWVIQHSRKADQLNLAHLNVLTAVLFAAKPKAEWYESFTGHGCNSSFQDAEG